MRKFWKMDMIPKDIQKLIERNLREAKAMANGGALPAANPKDAVDNFNKQAEELLRKIAEDKKKDSKEEQDIRDIPEEKIIKG